MVCEKSHLKHTAKNNLSAQSVVSLATGLIMDSHRRVFRVLEQKQGPKSSEIDRKNLGVRQKKTCSCKRHMPGSFDFLCVFVCLCHASERDSKHSRPTKKPRGMIPAGTSIKPPRNKTSRVKHVPVCGMDTM